MRASISAPRSSIRSSPIASIRSSRTILGKSLRAAPAEGSDCAGTSRPTQRDLRALDPKPRHSRPCASRRLHETAAPCRDHKKAAPAPRQINTATIDASGPNAPPVSTSEPWNWLASIAVRIAAGHAGTEHAAFGEIPGGVQAEHHPEPPRDHEHCREQHAGLERDRDAAGQRRARIERVQRAEQRGRERERDPAAEALLDDAEQARRASGFPR